MDWSGKILVASVVFLLGSCGRESSSVPRNLLLITFDTTRADRLGCYGHEAAQTPVVDALAAKGARFLNCFSPTPVTLPSHATLLTGMEPWHHGARNNATHLLPPPVVTLAETLQAVGFQNAAVVSAMVLDSRYGLDQGFALYDDDLSSAEAVADFMFRETRASNTTDRALEWLQGKEAGRWFLWVHYFDPHADRRAPEPWASQVTDPYDAEIAYADSELGRLIAGLRGSGEWADTLVVFTADHGESLGEHGERTHGLFLYDATTRVPLILQHSSLPQGVGFEGAVGLVDIAPTVLDLLQVPGPVMDGESLVPVFRGTTGRRAPVYQESRFPFYGHGMADLRALRGDDFRYILAPHEEYYDLQEDPRELRNLHEKDVARSFRWHSWLTASLPETEADSMARNLTDLSFGERQALASLGYVWSEETSTPLPADSSLRPDPKDRVEFWERNNTIYELVRLETWAELEPLLLTALQENPESLESRKLWVRTLLATDRPQEARQQAGLATTLPGASGEIFLLLAEALRACGEEGWRSAIARAQAANAMDPDPDIRLGDYLVEDGLHGEAEQAFRRALALDESSAAAWMGLARIARRNGNGQDAEAHLRRSLALDASSSEAWFALGVLLLSSGNPEEAEACFVATLQRQENHVRAWVNLGNLAQRQSQGEKAEAHYRQALTIRPRHLEANFNLGVLLLERQDPAAAGFFQRVLEIRPDDSRASDYLREAQGLNS